MRKNKQEKIEKASENLYFLMNLNMKTENKSCNVKRIRNLYLQVFRLSIYICKRIFLRFL